MHALIIGKNKILSELLCRNLRCENILNEFVSIHDNYKNKIFYNEFDCIIFNLTKINIAIIETMDIFNKINLNKPIFLLIDKNQLDELHNLNFKTKYIYPSDIPTRYLSYEIKKVLNQKFKTNKKSKIKVHDLVLDLSKREASRFGNKFFLRNKEFQLLEFLMNNTNTLLSRQIILENVWDRNAYFITNTVDVHINCLRKKIDYKKNDQLIETVYCSGYIFHSKPFLNN